MNSSKISAKDMDGKPKIKKSLFSFTCCMAVEVKTSKEITAEDCNRQFCIFKTKTFNKDTDAPHSNTTLIEPTQSITNEKFQQTMKKLFLKKSDTCCLETDPKYSPNRVQDEFKRICENSLNDLDTIKSNNSKEMKDDSNELQKKSHRKRHSSKVKSGGKSSDKAKITIRDDCDLELVSDSDFLDD